MQKKSKKLTLTSVTNLRLPFVPWNFGPKTGGKKSNPSTMTARAAKLAKKKELYLENKS